MMKCFLVLDTTTMAVKNTTVIARSITERAYAVDENSGEIKESRSWAASRFIYL
jgi:hypothetical protein